MFQCIVDTAQFLFLFHCVRELQFVFAESDSRTAPGRQKNPNAVFLFCFRFSFYSLFLFVYFNYAAAFGNACLYGLLSDFCLMFRVQPFRKPNDMLIQCKNRTFSFIIGLCSVIHAVKQEHRPVEFKRKLHRLRIG